MPPLFTKKRKEERFLNLLVLTLMELVFSLKFSFKIYLLSVVVLLAYKNTYHMGA